MSRRELLRGQSSAESEEAWSNDEDDDDEEDQIAWATAPECDLKIDSQARSRRRWHALLCRNLQDDDPGSALVFVFTRSQKRNGVVDDDEIMDDALKHAQKVFPNVDEGVLEEELKKLAPENGSSMTVGTYNEFVRRKMRSIIWELGFKASCFESIDGDESFLTIRLDPTENFIKQYAFKLGYSLPVSQKAYEQKGPDMYGIEKGEQISNWKGQPVYAYTSYDTDLDENQYLQGFRDVDIIRISVRVLSARLDLNQLIRQNILTTWFPAARGARVEYLKRYWAAPCRFWTVFMATHVNGSVRNYFGEEIAFMFRFFRYYCWMLLFLLPFSVAAFLLDRDDIRRKVFPRREVDPVWVKLAFGLVLSIWAQLFLSRFQRAQLRQSQYWGTHLSLPADVLLLADFKKHKKPSDFRCKKRLVETAKNAYMLVFTLIMFAFGHYGPLFLTCLTQVFSLLWGQLAPMLVGLTNPRTQVIYDTYLVRTLGYVRVFLYITPFIYTMFVVQYAQHVCGSDKEDAAIKFFNVEGKEWPQMHGWTDNTTARDVLDNWIDPYTFTKWSILQDHSNETCVWGCMPTDCRKDQGCGETTCIHAAESQVFMAFFSQVGCQVFFWLIMPLALVVISTQNELRTARRQRESPSSDEEDGESKPDGHLEYNSLQFQAKCSKIAPYEYLSWGGSYVEDFQELVNGFTILICLGPLQPTIAVIGFFTSVMSYKMLAYRFTRITCRPYPFMAKGITYWGFLLDDVCRQSIFIVALLLPCMSPIKDWPVIWRAATFFTVGYVFSVAQNLVESALKTTPEDIEDAEDFNATLLRNLRVTETDVSPKTDGKGPPASFQNLDIDLLRHEAMSEEFGDAQTPTEKPKSILGNMKQLLFG